MMTESSMAVWLYGSHSRGDNDELSDLDILLVSDEFQKNTDISKVCYLPRVPSISHYSWKEMLKMANYGSLFLKHIKLEGQPLYESTDAQGWLTEVLANLGAYQFSSRDLKGFKIVLSDIVESLSTNHASLIFEAATLGTIFRHASILGCNLSNSPCFSRFEPIENITNLWNLPRNWSDEFPSLYQYRLFSEGRMEQIDRPTIEFLRIWCQRANSLLDKLEGQIHVEN